MRRAKALGFTLNEIQELLSLSGRREQDMAGLKAAAAEKLADVEHRLAELTRIRDGLQTLVASCPGHGELDRCPHPHRTGERGRTHEAARSRACRTCAAQ